MDNESVVSYFVGNREFHFRPGQHQGLRVALVQEMQKFLKREVSECNAKLSPCSKYEQELIDCGTVLVRNEGTSYGEIVREAYIAALDLLKEEKLPATSVTDMATAGVPIEDIMAAERAKVMHPNGVMTKVSACSVTTAAKLAAAGMRGIVDLVYTAADVWTFSRGQTSDIADALRWLLESDPSLSQRYALKSLRDMFVAAVARGQVVRGTRISKKDVFAIEIMGLRAAGRE